ncbi:hypothetical protein BH10PSE6_BH10PSE6_57410 [soil metagenome]
MHLGRRAAVGGLAAAGIAGGAQAAEWPDKNIVWVVPFPAGGSTDVFARSIGSHVSAPKATPEPVLDRMHAAIQKALASDKVKQQ